MAGAPRTLVQEFGMVRTGIGMIGNARFLAGSIRPASSGGPSASRLSIAGAFPRPIGSTGNLLVGICEARERRRPRQGGIP